MGLFVFYSMDMSSRGSQLRVHMSHVILNTVLSTSMNTNLRYVYFQKLSILGASAKLGLTCDIESLYIV